MLMPVLWILGGLVISIILWLAYLCISAWWEVKNTVRKPMILCDRHGPILEENVITFMEVPYCPLCWNEKWNAAKQTKSFPYDR